MPISACSTVCGAVYCGLHVRIATYPVGHKWGRQGAAVVLFHIAPTGGVAPGCACAHCDHVAAVKLFKIAPIGGFARGVALKSENGMV